MSEHIAEPLDTGVVAPASDVTPPSTTIEASIEAAYDALQETPEDQPPAPEEAQAPEAQPRAPDGKFAASEPEAPAEPVAPTVPDYIAPFVPEFERRGLPVQTGITNLLHTWQALETNPEGTLKWLAGQYGFEVNRPGQAPQQQPPAQQQQQPAADEWVDPAVQQLRQELAELKARDTAREQRAQEAQNIAYAQAMQSVQSEIQAFATNKAKADGIDFNALRPTMAALISSGQANDLDDAYEKAVWANPTTRAARIEAERNQSAARLAEENARNAAAARRAGQINVRTDTAVPVKGRTTEETIAMAAEQIYGRA